MLRRCFCRNRRSNSGRLIGLIVDWFIGKTETKLEYRNSVKTERLYVVLGPRYVEKAGAPRCGKVIRVFLGNPPEFFVIWRPESS